MTYPKLVVQYDKGVPVIDPPDGGTEKIPGQGTKATYYPNRWAINPDEQVLRMRYDDDDQKLVTGREAGEGRDRIKLYIPLDRICQWKVVYEG